MINFSQLAHLPQCRATHASLQHPVKFKLCTESFLSVPRSAVVDGIISYGGSTGIGFNLPRKAYGEFFERNHFFTTVPIDSQKALLDVTPAAYQEKLLTLCLPADKEQLLQHHFSFTTVYNLFDDSPHDYFFNAISLNGVKGDAPYLNFSDSCACACHPIKEKALHCALMEFLERQALLGSWLSQTCQYAINPELLKSLTPYANLTEKLLENGELYIVEINNKLPGYTVMMFYFADSEKDIVQYSVGAKSGLSLAEALTSALEELYQCYTFLYNLESTNNQLENKAGSGYHVTFQQYNNRETKAKIPFIQQNVEFKINDLDDIRSARTFTYQEVLSDLAKLSQQIFYYHYYEHVLNLHYIKILSPDFFAHMSLTKSLNLDNLYAKATNITRETAYLERIPFP